MCWCIPAPIALNCHGKMTQFLWQLCIPAGWWLGDPVGESGIDFTGWEKPSDSRKPVFIVNQARRSDDLLRLRYWWCLSKASTQWCHDLMRQSIGNKLTIKWFGFIWTRTRHLSYTTPPLAVNLRLMLFPITKLDDSIDRPVDHYRRKSVLTVLFPITVDLLRALAYIFKGKWFYE